jgi:hypothetical protein
VEWRGKTGRYFDSNKEPHPLPQLCGYVGISYNTYVGGKESTRREAGHGVGVGKKCPIKYKDQKFLVDVMAWKDRANEGLAVYEGVDLVQDLLPHLSRSQAQQTFVRTVQQKHMDVLKKKMVLAQSTTMNRTGINIPQQFRWMSTYDKLIGFLREKNSGTFNLTGKFFRKLIRYFVYGGDETCMQECDNGAT